MGISIENELFTIKDYGSVTIDIRQYMDAKGISRNALARACNTRFEVINKWYGGYVEKIDADVLARICYVLSCSPGDIIKYERNNAAG